MTLGEKLRRTRQEKGLSQSQVAGEHMTRNMLSQLENDLASPSVKTLLYLAETLGVSAGWLLDENAAIDPDVVTAQAREAYRKGDHVQCLRLLSDWKQPLDDEKSLLLFRSAVACSERALAAGNLAEAERLLNSAEQCRSVYLEQAERLSVLKLRLRCCLMRGEPNEALLHKLHEVWDSDEIAVLTAQHELLQGRLAVEQKRYDEALMNLHRAEKAGVLTGKEQSALFRLLEHCYKSKEDYKMAYHYAVLRADGE